MSSAVSSIEDMIAVESEHSPSGLSTAVNYLDHHQRLSDVIIADNGGDGAVIFSPQLLQYRHGTDVRVKYALVKCAGMGAPFEMSLRRRGWMADIKSVLRKHKTTKDRYQQQPSELVHILPEAQNLRLKQLWPLPAADQILPAPNFAELAAAALEPNAVSSKTTHQQLAELLHMPHSHGVLLKQLWPLPSIDRPLSIYRFAQLAPDAFDDVIESHHLFKDIRKTDLKDVTTVESRYAQSEVSLAFHSPDFNQLKRVIGDGHAVVFRTETTQHQSQPDSQMTGKEEMVILDNRQLEQALNIEVKQAVSSNDVSCAVINSSSIPPPSSDLPRYISKVLHSIFKCLVNFRKMKDVPVRKTDFKGISTLASRYAQTGLLNALNFPFDNQLNCDICARKGVLNRTQIKQLQPGVGSVDKVQKLQNIELSERWDNRYLTEQAQHAEVEQCSMFLSDTNQSSYSDSSISVLSASLEPADDSSDYEVVSMNDIEIIDDEWQAEPSQQPSLPDANTNQSCSVDDDNSASVLAASLDDSSLESVLVRDVEMLSDQQQQLNELLHILRTQNNQLRQLMPQLSPTDDADNDDQTSTIDEFDLMTAASHWSGEADSLLEHIEQCVVEQSRRIADVMATASRQNAELKAACCQQQLS